MKRLKEEINAAESVLIYGAGNYGTELIAYMRKFEEWDEKITAVVITGEPDRDTICDIPYRRIDDMVRYRDSSTVILAVSEEKQDKIIHNLERLGFESYCRMDEYDFSAIKRANSRYSLEDRLQDVMGEVVYAHNFERALEECGWITKRNINAGDAAVRHRYLYNLLYLLNTGKFKNILDIGMGSTTKIISQYVAYDKEAEHTVVESDVEWIDFMHEQWQLPANSHIVQMDYEMKEVEGSDVRVYRGFKEKIAGGGHSKRYDLISIDAPAGFDMKKYSRIDILNILPECLKDSWVIMIDDVNRTGERNTISLIKKSLEEKGIKYAYREHRDINAFVIFASWDYKFFTSL